MKAYKASNDDCETHEVVFAETASKARSYAFGLEALQDAEFIHINIHRAYEFDQFSTGENRYLNWGNIDVQRVCRSNGWWIGDDWSSCDWCGLYEYDDLKESHLTETESGVQCAECLTNQ